MNPHLQLEATILICFVDGCRRLPQPKKRSTFHPEKIFKNLMAGKEKKAQHEMTVTAEVHKPAEKTPVPRKQPT